MPWREVSVMDQKLDFVRLALLPGANRRELCRRFGISATTGYKWLRRFDERCSAGTACRTPSSSAMARPGATRRASR